MRNFNITNPQGSIIGNGFIRTDNFVFINTIILDELGEYAELNGKHEKNGFSLYFKTGEEILKVDNIQENTFNINDTEGNYLGLARIL